MKKSIKVLAFIFAILLFSDAASAVRHSGADSSKSKRPFTLSNESYQADVQLASDFIVSQKGCFSAQIGYDYLQTSMVKIVQQYIDIYNDRWPFRRISVQQQNVWHNTNFMDDLQFEIKVENRLKYGEITNSKRSVGDQNKFKIEVPIKVLPKQGKVSFDTSIAVSVEVYNIKQNVNNKEVTIPQVKMSLDRQIDIKNWKCEDKSVDQCNRVQNDLINTFAYKIFSFEDGAYFDQPSAYRLVGGMATTFNEYAQQNAAAVYLDLDNKNQNLNVILNCKNASEILANPVAADIVELSVGQNLMDMFAPTEYMLEVQYIFDHLRDFNSTTMGFISTLGLDSNMGLLRATTDPAILSQLDISGLPKAGLRKFPNARMDELNVKMLDRIEITQNLFVEYHGGRNKDQTVIIPIEIGINFLAGFRQGIGSRNGHMQEFGSEWLHPFKIEMKPCQKVVGHNERVQDNDDIDVICSDSFRQLFNHVTLHKSDLVKEKITSRFSSASVNVWHTFWELEQPFSLLCAGIEIKQPQSRIEDGRYVMTIKQRKDAINIDQYCDNKFQELWDLHPRHMDEDPDKVQAIKDEIQNQITNDQYHYMGRLLDKTWWPDRFMNLQMVSPFLHFLSAHHGYEDLCRTEYPDFNDNEIFRCSMVYSYFKRHDDYDRIMDFDRSFFGYHDDIEQKDPMIKLRLIGKWILYFGLLLFLLEIQIEKNVMIWSMCILNFILLLPSLWMPFRRYGPDFTAYLNQAGQFVAGQTDYLRISSVQGQCFYPAGHLWHYVPVYWLFMLTDKGEYIWKVCHFAIHSGINYYVAQITYSYFRDRPVRAQLVCFVILCNEEVREFNQYLFNDSIMALYIAICIYYVSANKPFHAALFFTLGASIKAGVMLLLPSFLGWLQYIYGTRKLLACFALIVGFQVIIMMPLSFDPVAHLFGFKAGGTHWKDYLKYSKFLGGDKDRQYGATYENTIYFQIVGEKIYYQQWFVDSLKMGILVVNVYYFFLRHWCLPQCFSNLFDTLNPKWELTSRQTLTWLNQKKAIELLLISYLGGVQLVPGGHQQFQMWYWDYLPLAIEMTGFPAILTFKLYHDIFPCDIRAPIVHHNFTILLSLWLLTFGPDFYQKWFTQKLQAKKQMKVKKE